MIPERISCSLRTASRSRAHSRSSVHHAFVSQLEGERFFKREEVSELRRLVGADQAAQRYGNARVIAGQIDDLARQRHESRGIGRAQFFDQLRDRIEQRPLRARSNAAKIDNHGNHPAAMRGVSRWGWQGGHGARRCRSSELREDNLARMSVDQHLKVVGQKVADRTAFLVHDGRVDAQHGDAGAEQRGLVDCGEAADCAAKIAPPAVRTPKHSAATTRWVRMGRSPEKLVSGRRVGLYRCRGGSTRFYKVLQGSTTTSNK